MATISLTPAKLALTAFQKGLGGLPSVQKAGQTAALALRTPTDHDQAVSLFQEGKALLKVIAAHYKSAEDWLKTKTAEKNALKAADLARVEPFVTLLDAGIVSYRLRLTEERLRQTREEVEKERRRLEAEQKKEAERLEAEAKKTRGQERKDLLAEAAAVKETPLPSVESTVQRIQQQTEAFFNMPGQAPSAEYWSARIDDLRLLVAVIVGLDDELYRKAGEFRKARAQWQQVAVEAVIGIARVKGQLEASPYLNGQARSMEKRMRIPGVTAVSRDGLRNT